MRLLKIFITIVLLFTLTSCTATYALNPKLEMKVRLDRSATGQTVIAE